MKSKLKMNSPVYSDKIFLKIIFEARIDLDFYILVTRKSPCAHFLLEKFISAKPRKNVDSRQIVKSLVENRLKSLNGGMIVDIKYF